jgi:hypothetical protein
MAIPLAKRGESIYDDQRDKFPITTVGKDNFFLSSPQVGGGDLSEKNLADP